MKGRSIGEVSLRTNSRLALPRVVPRVKRGNGQAISSDLSGQVEERRRGRYFLATFVSIHPLPSTSFRSLRVSTSRRWKRYRTSSRGPIDFNDFNSRKETRWVYEIA